MKSAINKALSFYTWTEKAVKNPSQLPSMFWEKVLLEGDTLLYLQKISASSDETELSVMVVDTINLLLLINQLNDHLKADDLHSNAAMNLVRDIDQLAVSLREEAQKFI